MLLGQRHQGIGEHGSAPPAQGRMESVRDHSRAAWVLLGIGIWPAQGCSLGTNVCVAEEAPMEPWWDDLFYIGLTIVVFAVLWLLVKGVERFER
jgi:hypothetical protein